MSLDLAATEYRLVFVDSSNTQYNIKNFVTSLGWEENENELAVRITFAVRNDSTSKGRLSSLIKPGCLVGIFATVGSKDEEVARGNVVSWNPQSQSSLENLKCICYDDLYQLQESQDNRYYSSGTGTKAIITDIFDEWEIPTKTYSGPNASHGKLKYNGTYVSDIILDVLDDAKKKGYGSYVLRSTQGYTDVVERGSNSTVYVFRVDITKSASTTITTADLVTRVRVYGQADDDGKSSVEATLNGLTKYGIRQRIYNRGSDETLEDAKSAAQDILDEDGVIQQEMTLQAPDVPFIRKGDLVYVTAGVSEAYFFVKGIQHDCESYTMTMDLEKADTEEEAAASSGSSSSSSKEYAVGDIVTFNGGTHYVSSYSGSKGYSASAGQAKITKINSSQAHPYHLIHTDSGSNVYGWVDTGTFS